jgi:hypothetical protein
MIRLLSIKNNYLKYNRIFMDLFVIYSTIWKYHKKHKWLVLVVNQDQVKHKQINNA